MRAVLQANPETLWPVMDSSCEFLWAIEPMAFVQAIKSSGEIVEGYFRGLDRATGNITLSKHESTEQLIRGIGVKTLISFKKFRVDRLGLSRAEVHSEVRTWRGKACI